MKKVMVGILALVVMTAAQASNGPMEAANFESLTNILLQGVKKPTAAKVINIAFSGRCFSSRTPNQADNAGVFFKQTKGLLTAYRYNEPRGNEDFFDDMNVKDVIAWDPTIPGFDASDDFFAIKNPTGFSSFEQFGKYLVEEVITFQKIPGRLANRWVVTDVCYYFNPKEK
jgi:hypothetical protein